MTETNRLTAMIKPWVGPLIAASENGDTKATQVIDLYNLYVAFPSDNAAAALFEIAFLEWRKRAGKP